MGLTVMTIFSVKWQSTPDTLIIIQLVHTRRVIQARGLLLSFGLNRKSFHELCRRSHTLIGHIATSILNAVIRLARHTKRILVHSVFEQIQPVKSHISHTSTAQIILICERTRIVSKHRVLHIKLTNGEGIHFWDSKIERFSPRQIHHFSQRQMQFFHGIGQIQGVLVDE